MIFIQNVLCLHFENFISPGGLLSYIQLTSFPDPFIAILCGYELGQSGTSIIH